MVEINIDGAKGEGERNSIQFGMSTNHVRELCVQYVRGKEDKGNDNGMMRSIEEKDVKKKQARTLKRREKEIKNTCRPSFKKNLSEIEGMEKSMKCPTQKTIIPAAFLKKTKALKDQGLTSQV